MEELKAWLGGVFALIGLIIGAILLLCAVGLVIGFWPLALLIAAGAAVVSPDDPMRGVS